MRRRAAGASTERRKELRLVCTPYPPLAINPLQRPVLHPHAKNLVDAIAQRGVVRREDPHVMPGLKIRGKDGQTAYPMHRAHGDDVVEKNRVEASRAQVLVWM